MSDTGRVKVGIGVGGHERNKHTLTHLVGLQEEKGTDIRAT